MKYYMAPMEGMTGYVFRNAYQKYYGDVDTYFTPFISSVGLSHKELSDVLPEHNQGLHVVPQILTNRAEDFLAIAERMKEFGYDTVNLNLGCPSGTVVSKGRGAGFLKDPEVLLRFLDEIFTKCPLKISVKTRAGVQDPEEWGRLRDVYNRFPMEELILHPRLQKDFYKHPVREEIFRDALENCVMPVCYNGELRSVRAFARFVEEFPQTERVMFGRGIFQNPELVGSCRDKMGRIKREGEVADQETDTEPVMTQERFDTLRGMLAELLAGYRSEMGNDLHTLYKMKEIWTYLGQSIPAGERAVKRITKARSISEYKIAAGEALRLWEGSCCLHN